MDTIILSASSDIGYHAAARWASRGHGIVGTYRTPSGQVRELRRHGARLFRCDMSRNRSAIRFLSRIARWDVLLFCSGTMEPIGPFDQVSFPEWKKSVEANFLSQLRFLHTLLPKRNRRFPHGPVAIFFAGGGTNSAPVNYSAYTVSKIALIKMVELLDAEIPDTRFSILGPGWVDTKIHRETLRAGGSAGEAYRKTLHKLDTKEGMTPMETVIDCCDWIIQSPRDVVSGRNFSVAHDRWGDRALAEELKADAQMYKLRRCRN